MIMKNSVKNYAPQYGSRKNFSVGAELSEQLERDSRIDYPASTETEIDIIREILDEDTLNYLLENDVESSDEADIVTSEIFKDVLIIEADVDGDDSVVSSKGQEDCESDNGYEGDVSFSLEQLEKYLENDNCHNGESDIEAIKSFDEIMQVVADIELSKQGAWNLNFDEDDFDSEECMSQFSYILNQTEITEDEILSIVEKTDFCESNKTPLLIKKQFGNQATPYVYGMQVLKNNQLCYIDTADSGNMLHIYNGRYWQFLDDDSLKQLAYDALPEYIKHAVSGIEHLITNIANYVRREVKKAYNEGRKRFSSQDYCDIENHIVFQNCVYDVKTGEKKDFSYKKPYYYAVECEYTDEDIETPYYDKFKYDSTQGDQDSMEMFDLMQAYLLIPNRKGKCFFIMSYAKDSGKTSFGEFIEKYFPDELVKKVDIEHLGGKFSYAGFDKAVLISCLELPLAKLSPSATKALKNFTGESKIEMEQKYQNQFTSKVRFKTLLASNGGLYLPTGEKDDAFFRRVIVIPFIYSTPLDELIADMPQRWEKERSAIISKCVRKFKHVITDDGGIVFPESFLSKEIKAKWMGDSLVNERFIREVIIYTGDKNDAITKKDLEIVYEAYYDQNTCGMGSDKPIKCSKDDLNKMIQRIYPNAVVSKARRPTLANPDKKENLYCILGVKWDEKYLRELEGENGNE